jgi:hypothetical protein
MCVALQYEFGWQFQEAQQKIWNLMRQMKALKVFHGHCNSAHVFFIIIKVGLWLTPAEGNVALFQDLRSIEGLHIQAWCGAHQDVQLSKTAFSYTTHAGLVAGEDLELGCYINGWYVCWICYARLVGHDLLVGA